MSDKEMDRKDFLKHSGLVLVGTTGLTDNITALVAESTGPSNG